MYNIEGLSKEELKQLAEVLADRLHWLENENDTEKVIEKLDRVYEKVVEAMPEDEKEYWKREWL